VYRPAAAMTWFYEHYRDVSAIGVHTTALLHEEKSPYQAIKVYETKGHGRFLTLDDMVMVTELDEFAYHDLLTHVPLCLHADPKRVLVVGGGDGGTVREVLRHPEVEEVVLCEIDERVTRVCQEFIPSVAGALEDPRVHLHFEDAVAYIQNHKDHFDAILVDSSEPIGPAEGLFGASFLSDVRDALRPGGVMSAQAESPFYAPEVITSFFANARESFDSTHAYTGVVPTYPGGLWTFMFASRERSPSDLDRGRADALGARYLDAKSIEAAFALPPFVRKLVEGN
jgi:spermidine synthase